MTITKEDLTQVRTRTDGAYSPVGERKCRVCGCTKDKACMTKDGPCHWVEEDLCSACKGG